MRTLILVLLLAIAAGNCLGTGDGTQPEICYLYYAAACTKYDHIPPQEHTAEQADEQQRCTSIVGRCLGGF